MPPRPKPPISGSHCRSRRGRPGYGRCSKASSLGRSISWQNRPKDHGQVAGMPRSSRYQLRQPVLQMVLAAAATRSASNWSVADSGGADLPTPAGVDQLDELHDVGELHLGDLDEGEIPHRAVGTVHHGEVGEPGYRYRQVGTRAFGPGLGQVDAVSPDHRHRSHEGIHLESGGEHDDIEVVELAVNGTDPAEPRCGRWAR